MTSPHPRQFRRVMIPGFHWGDVVRATSVDPARTQDRSRNGDADPVQEITTGNRPAHTEVAVIRTVQWRSPHFNFEEGVNPGRTNGRATSPILSTDRGLRSKAGNVYVLTGERRVSGLTCQVPWSDRVEVREPDSCSRTRAMAGAGALFRSQVTPTKESRRTNHFVGS